MITTCEVNGWGKTVEFRIDTTGREARKMCAATTQLMAANTNNFFRGKDWTLQIFSPYSGTQPIAVCDLY